MFFLARKAFLECDENKNDKSTSEMTAEEWVYHHILTHQILVEAVAQAKLKLNLDAEENNDWHAVLEQFGNKSKDIIRKTKKKKLKQKQYEKKINSSKTGLHDSKNVKIRIEKLKNIKDKSKPENNTEKKLKLKTIKSIETNRDLSQEIQKIGSKNDSDLENTTVSDSFFVTTNGKNYESSVTRFKNSNTSEVEDSKNNKNNSHSTHTWKSNKTKDFNKSHQKNNYERKPNDKWRYNTDFNQFKTANEPQEKLHPSWEAKLKLKAPVKFQGSRMRFDDDDSNSKIVNSPFKKQAVEFNSPRNQSHHKQSTEKLHPSWEAKMKQKAPVEFKGSKITFDD